MPDLLSLGEVLIEMTRHGEEGWYPTVAGDAFNVLFYASRLGLATGLVSAFGDDLFTDAVELACRSEGIDTSCVERVAGGRNGLYFVEVDTVGEYAFHYWRSGSAATTCMARRSPGEMLAAIPESPFLLLTGVTLAVMPEHDRIASLLEELRRRGTLIVLDSNWRPRLWSSPNDYTAALERILPHTDIFLPTAGDLSAAWPGRSIEELADRFGSLGVSELAVKLGREGAGWIEGGALVTRGSIATRVVDTTGAGDAFNAGYIAARLRGLEVNERVDLAQRTAAAALGVRGAIDREFMRRNAPL